MCSVNLLLNLRFMYRRNFQGPDHEFTKIHQTFLVTSSEGNFKVQKRNLNDVLRKNSFLRNWHYICEKRFSKKLVVYLFFSFILQYFLKDKRGFQLFLLIQGLAILCNISQRLLLKHGDKHKKPQDMYKVRSSHTEVSFEKATFAKQLY